MGRKKRWSVRSGRWTVWAEARSVGTDWFLVVAGGDRPHVGALGWISPGEPSGGYQYPGHRESVLVQLFLDALGDKTPIRAVLAGVHVDNPGPGDLEAIVEACTTLSHRVACHFSKEKSL